MSSTINFNIQVYESPNTFEDFSITSTDKSSAIKALKNQGIKVGVQRSFGWKITLPHKYPCYSVTRL